MTPFTACTTSFANNSLSLRWKFKINNLRAYQFTVHASFSSIDEDISVIFRYPMGEKILDKFAGFPGSDFVARNYLRRVDLQLYEFVRSSQ